MKADLGLGDTGDIMSSPAPKTAAAAPQGAPLPNNQAMDELIISLVRDSPAKEMEGAPSWGDGQLQSTEILTGEPILLPPLNFDDLPFARLAHPKEEIGPASQEVILECTIKDAGPKDGEKTSLAVNESASIAPAQRPPLPADKIKLV